MNGSPSYQKINLNFAALDNASNEFVTATIYHEIVHAELRNQGISASEHHEVILSDWFDKISNQLQKDYPSLTEDDANALTWGGLGDTEKWQEILDEDNEDPSDDIHKTEDIANLNTNHKNLNNANGSNYGTHCSD